VARKSLTVAKPSGSPIESRISPEIEYWAEQRLDAVRRRSKGSKRLKK
jgi:hypothetical protein